MRWMRGIAFVGVGAALFAIVYAISETVDPVYPVVHERMRIIAERGDSIEALSVGNSHAGAVDFDVMGLRGMHLSRGGGDVFEAVYYARDAAARLPQLRYLLLNVSYFSLRVDNANVRGNTGVRHEMYARTRSRRWLPGDRDLFISAKLAPVVRPDHWGRVLGTLLGLPVEQGLVTGDGATPVAAGPAQSEEDLAMNAVHATASQMAPIGSVRQRAPAMVSRATAQLDTLISAMARRGVQTILYTAPYHHEYTAHFEPVLIAEMKEAMTAMDRRHDSAVWLDFSEHPELVRRPDLFRNADHVNATGAAAFSRLLAEHLRSRGDSTLFRSRQQLPAPR